MKKTILQSLSSGLLMRAGVIISSLYLIRLVNLEFGESFGAIWLYVSFLLSFFTFLDFGNSFALTSIFVERCKTEQDFNIAFTRGLFSTFVSASLLSIFVAPILFLIMKYTWLDKVDYRMFSAFYISGLLTAYVGPIDAVLIAKKKHYVRNYVRVIPTLFGNIFFLSSLHLHLVSFEKIFVFYFLIVSFCRMFFYYFAAARLKIRLSKGQIKNLTIFKILSEDFYAKFKYFFILLASFLINSLDIMLAPYLIHGNELLGFLFWRKVFSTIQLSQYFMLALWPNFHQLKVSLGLSNIFGQAVKIGFALSAANGILFLILFVLFGGYLLEAYNVSEISRDIVLVIMLSIGILNLQGAVGLLFNDRELLARHVVLYGFYAALYLFLTFVSNFFTHYPAATSASWFVSQIVTYSVFAKWIIRKGNLG